MALMSEALGWQQVIFTLGVITLALAGAAFVITRDRPSDMTHPTIQDIKAEEKGEPAPGAKTTETIPTGKALKMTFGAGMEFWPLAIWFFFMHGSIII